MTKFKQGDKVKHIDGTQEMYVDNYQIQKIKNGRNDLTQETIYKNVPTNNVICSWLDNNNFRQQDLFPENELIFI